MPDDFDPYYLWLGIPPRERPANHYRLLGVPLFEENPSVIESAADRQMAHLRSVQAGQHSGLSQKLLNEVAAAKVCLLRPPQKAKYDQALRAKLDGQASRSNSAAQGHPATGAAVQPMADAVQTQPSARAQPIAAAPAQSGSENFWEDVTGGGAPPAPSKTSKSQQKPQPRRAAASAPNRLKQLWPVLLVAGACLLVGVVVVIKSIGGQNEEPSPGGVPATILAPKAKESLLVFDWPAESRAGLLLTVDGAKVVGPSSGRWEYHCLPGPHHVIASRGGFKPIDKMVDAPVDSIRKIADAWQPLATLALDWPLDGRDGAVLNVDGRLLAVGNDQPFSVPVEPGTHTIRITRVGFLPLEKNITVAADQRQDVSIAFRATAAAIIVRWPSSEREGAELRIDGEVRQVPGGSNGETVTLPMTPGTHELFIWRQGYRPFSESVSVAAAEQQTITPKWNALPQLSTDTATTVKNGPGHQASNSKAPETATAPSPPVAKHPVPAAADQQRVAKQLDEIYKPAHDAAKDLAQAKELSDLAAKADDLSERYMLYLKAVDLAVQGADLSLAIQIVDRLDGEFEIIAPEIKLKVFDRFLKGPATAEQISEAVSTAERMIDEAIAADRYDIATSAIAVADKFLLKKTVDPEFHRDSEKALVAYRARIKALQPLSDAAHAAKKILDVKPDDADANSTLGRWYCFYKGDWSWGLPMLVKGGNPRMKPVAELELKASADASQKLELADQWWDLAQKETGAAADSIHLHAGDLYRAAMPGLTSVLRKAAVEKRLAEITEISSRAGDAGSGPHSGPIVFQRGRWFDILKLVDLDRDRVVGNWTRNGAEISCSAGVSNSPRVILPVVLDGGYDLEVDFTRHGGYAVHTIFFVGRQPCGLTLSAGSYAGLDSVNGVTYQNFRSNLYRPADSQLQNEHKYQQVISVRLGKGGIASVDVAMDGKQYLRHWEGDPSALGVDSRFLPIPKQPALETSNATNVTFHAVRVRMVSGQGRYEAPLADQVKVPESNGTKLSR